MQEDFHYYATYCAAYLAGYSHEESMKICYSAQFVDCCTRTLLSKIKAPLDACTTQSTAELSTLNMNKTDRIYVTRIWSSFHFLPSDLYREVTRGPKVYKSKFRLICGPNGDLLTDTVNLAKGQDLPWVGMAMHILADTWAHMYFAGTPSLVINNTDYSFKEVLETEQGPVERPLKFHLGSQNLDESIYLNSPYSMNEHSIMNLGHGRAGHLPDYSFIHYKYVPAWGNYEELDKNNPSDYIHAFAQMIYAMKYLRGEIEVFEKGKYDFDAIEPYKDEIMAIIRERRTDACEDWKAFGEKLSGQEINAFKISKYIREYMSASEETQNDTFLGKFILAALSQKSMITNRIFTSGNNLAGKSVDFNENGFKGVRSYHKLIETKKKRGDNA